jgi:capsular polysaccharide biosynthesis protein
VGGFLVSLTVPRTYEATASLLVGRFGSGYVTINDVNAIESLAATYSDVARRQPVMQAVVNDLGLHTSWRELGKNVHTRIPREDPQVIDITVEASSATEAQEVAASVSENVASFANSQNSSGSGFLRDEMASLEQDIKAVNKRLAELRAQDGRQAESDPALLKEINDLHAQLSQDQQNYVAFRTMASPASSAQVTILDSAHAGSDPVRPNVRFNTIIAGFVGLVLGVAAAYLLAARRRRIAPTAGSPSADSPAAKGESLVPLGSAK